MKRTRRRSWLRPRTDCRLPSTKVEISWKIKSSSNFLQLKKDKQSNLKFQKSKKKSMKKTQFKATQIFTKTCISIFRRLRPEFWKQDNETKSERE